MPIRPPTTATCLDVSWKERTIDGAGTKRWVLDASDCRDLAAHRIARLGWDEAHVPYERVRLQPAGSFIMACLSGTGRVLLEGRWQHIKEGDVCMAPPRVLNAFRAQDSEAWVFAWLRYDEPSQTVPLVGSASPVKLRGSADLARCIQGLRAEWEGRREPAMVHHWVELVHALARRLAHPVHKEERLGKLWQKVERHIATDWTLEGLAHEAGFSAEHLRRLCLRELGRTPMQQVTTIRMLAARHLLETSTEKLDVLARRVGYANASIFSRVFKRHVGLAPVDYRQGSSPRA